MRAVAEHLDRMCNLETLPTGKRRPGEEGPFSARSRRPRVWSMVWRG